MGRALVYISADGTAELSPLDEEHPRVKGKATDCESDAGHQGCGCLLDGAEPGTRVVFVRNWQELAPQLPHRTERARNEAARATFALRGVEGAGDVIHGLAESVALVAGGVDRKVDRATAGRFYAEQLRAVGKVDAAVAATMAEFNVGRKTVYEWKKKGWK